MTEDGSELVMKESLLSSVGHWISNESLSLSLWKLRCEKVERGPEGNLQTLDHNSHNAGAQTHRRYGVLCIGKYS